MPTNNEINSNRKEVLSIKIEGILSSNTALGNDPSLKTKGEKQQRRKCSQCGKSYLGQMNSSTCGDACRKRKSREG